MDPMMVLVDVLTQVSEEESDTNSQIERNEQRALGLFALATILMVEFTRTGTVEFIDKTIELQTQALLLTPEEHVNTAERLNGLGMSLYLRFQHLNEVGDVDKAIECLTRAVRLTPDGHADQPRWFNYLGIIYRGRFERFGVLADRDKMIECLAQAVLLTPDGHVDKPGLLDSLGSSYLSRFEHFDDVADVNKAIECQIQAVLLTPDDHSDKPGRLGNLGNSYYFRFRRLDSIADMDKAIEYQTSAVLFTSDDHADKPGRITNLGSSYQCRFDRLDEVDDMDKGIEYHTQAVLLTPDDHPDKPGLLNNLGTSYICRFQRLGEVADVDKAVEFQTQAVLLTPDGHAFRPDLLYNLGSSYQCRFLRLSELADLDKAIECQTQAVLLTPDGHGRQPILLNGLGRSYACRFQQLSEVSDVDKAIECQTRAVLLTPDGHAEKPVRLSDLGYSYDGRFRRLGEVPDVNKAIECLTQAVLLTPDGHAHKPSLLNCLGAPYRHRFEHLGEVVDACKAIECHTQAVLLTPDGHAHKPSRLSNLGNSYMSRFERLAQPPDLESAKSSFQCAAQHLVTNPETQIRCARHWAHCCASLGISPLPAYERCMELIPRVIWLGTTITQRYDLLTTVTDLAAEAAAWAISVDAYDLAIEWLEQGRSVVWNQILQLRTPFDELAAYDLALSERLKSIAAQLEDAGRRVTETPSSNNAPATLEKDVQRHHRLADEWEKALAEARTIPGFESYMRPRKAAELKRSATDGPIVLINVHSSRCDALIIFPQCDDVALLPLTDLSPDKTGGCHEQFNFSATLRCDTDRGFLRVKKAHEPNDPFKFMLAALWSTIVKPVLDALACTRRMPAYDLPHVTWCATGALAFLPLHAAGPYDGSSPNASDLVVSSYTPTLSALLASSTSTPISNVGVLAVCQQDTQGLPPLPCTGQELLAIEQHAKSIGYRKLDGESATINAVLDAMEEHCWVHLACHASQNPDNPAHSAFHLHDGDLTLEIITKRQFKNKGLAFLSACQTATGDRKMPDEAVHLAAGMLMAGYPSVIATMWRIHDEDGPEVARRVYAELLKDSKIDHRGAARALHKAVAGLREKLGEGSSECWRWVPFIHIGV